MPPLTDEEFETECKAQCESCRDGVTLRYRENTQEFVHDSSTKVSGLTVRVGHSLCVANTLRKERLAEQAQ